MLQFVPKDVAINTLYYTHVHSYHSQSKYPHFLEFLVLLQNPFFWLCSDPTYRKCALTIFNSLSFNIIFTTITFPDHLYYFLSFHHLLSLVHHSLYLSFLSIQLYIIYQFTLLSLLSTLFLAYIKYSHFTYLISLCTYPVYSGVNLPQNILVLFLHR